MISCSLQKEKGSLLVSTEGVSSRVSYQMLLKTLQGASLVAQWLRVRLPMQGMRVRALVWEDPTCCGAAGPVSHGR